jgi:hypothetical protein
MTPKTFHAARKLLDTIPNINRGGCGIAALALARWARQHSKKTGGFMFVDFDYGETCEHNQDALSCNDIDALVVPNHIAIKYAGRWYDTNEADVYSEWVIEDNITENILLYIINKGSWNLCFDRCKQVRVIETLLGIDLSDVWTSYAGYGYYQPREDQLT